MHVHAQLFLLNLILLRFISAVGFISSPFFCIRRSIILCVDSNNLFALSITDEYLFHFLAIMNKTAMNILAKTL